MITNAENIKNLYRERDRFVLFGLTGRTGSGCTTVSNILSAESFLSLSLRSYKTCDFASADERKYSVIYRFMKEGNNWEPFIVIEASTIIFSFILQEKYTNLWLFMDQIQKDGKLNNDDLKAELAKFLSGNDEAEWSGLTDEIIDNELSSFLNQIKNGNPDAQSTASIIDYFTKKLKEKKNAFAEILKRYHFEKMIQDDKHQQQKSEIYNYYTYFMQNAGNNIRSSGKFFDNSRAPGNEYSVVSRINDVIQLILKSKEKEPGTSSDQYKCRICIDALRNPMEIEYFRDKYRAFYALAVNTEDDYRKKRLGLSKEEIESIDRIEYPDEKDYYFYHQNIQACLQIADIYLYNPDSPNQSYFTLSEQLLKYIALILQPGLVTPTHIERCMQLAFNAKYNSGCLSRKVGAIVTGEDFSIRSVGWNDVPKGQVPCNLRCVEDYCKNQDENTFSQYELTDPIYNLALFNIKSELRKEKRKTGKLYSYCFKDIYNGIKGSKNQVYTRALHAEENAFLQIAKYGGAGIEGGKLFSTASPCELCSKKAYQLGIKEIYYIDPYPGISRTHILSFGHSSNPQMILFKGAIGNAYISLYSPKLPYKDEIEMLTGVSAKEIAQKSSDSAD